MVQTFNSQEILLIENKEYGNMDRKLKFMEVKYEYLALYNFFHFVQ